MIGETDIAELRTLFQSMPPHAGAAETMIRLKKAGFRLVMLTNSPPSQGSGSLDQAALAGQFEQIFSVDAVRKLQAATKVYQMVADALGVELPDLCLVAAHV